MKEIILAMFVGICIGTMPGVRESTPWGKPKPEPVVVVAPTPIQATPTPTPPGAWMYDKSRRTNLDRGNYDQRSGPGRAIILDSSGRPINGTGN
jgi:hypothetical protein